jgi:hypothetical protein
MNPTTVHALFLLAVMALLTLTACAGVRADRRVTRLDRERADQVDSTGPAARTHTR